MHAEFVDEAAAKARPEAECDRHHDHQDQADGSQRRGEAVARHEPQRAGQGREDERREPEPLMLLHHLPNLERVFRRFRRLASGQHRDAGPKGAEAEVPECHAMQRRPLERKGEEIQDYRDKQQRDRKVHDQRVDVMNRLKIDHHFARSTDVIEMRCWPSPSRMVPWTTTCWPANAASVLFAGS